MVILGIGYNWVYHSILNDSISASWWMAMMPSKTQKLFTGRCSLLIQGTISFQHQNCEISRRQWASHLEPESVIPRRDIVTHTTHTPIKSWTCIAIAIKWADLVPLAPPAVQWKIWDLKLDCSILKLTGQSMVCETLIFLPKPIYPYIHLHYPSVLHRFLPFARMFFHGPWIKFEPQSSTVAALAISIPPQKKNMIV